MNFWSAGSFLANISRYHYNKSNAVRRIYFGLKHYRKNQYRNNQCGKKQYNEKWRTRKQDN